MINAAVIGISGFGSVHYNDLMREHRNGRLKFTAAAGLSGPIGHIMRLLLQSCSLSILSANRRVFSLYSRILFS
jgi:hypothetical protein